MDEQCQILRYSVSMKADPRVQFERDYEEYSDAIFRFLYYKLQNRERALELAHDVFLRFFEYLSAGKEIEHTKTFLYRSAMNAFINEIRTKKGLTSLEEISEAGHEFVDDGDNAEELAAQREAVERARSLEDPYRSALLLRYVDDMAVREIAEIMETRENTVSVWLKRGVEQIRKKYG